MSFTILGIEWGWVLAWLAVSEILYLWAARGTYRSDWLELINIKITILTFGMVLTITIYGLAFALASIELSAYLTALWGICGVIALFAVNIWLGKLVNLERRRKQAKRKRKKKK